MALGHLENRRAAEVARPQVGIARGRCGQHAAEMVPGPLTDDQRRPLGEEAAHAARMVHVVMRQHHPADRLAGKFLLRRIHYP